MLKFVGISLLAFAMTVTLSGTVQAQTTLFINEFMASNSSVKTDPQDQFDDWIDIYNYGAPRND